MYFCKMYFYFCTQVHFLILSLILSQHHRKFVPLSSQESILQKVVMTAFADRTVVTIAVSKPPTPTNTHTH